MFRYPSAKHFVEYFRSYYGPTLKAFESLDPDGQEALAEDLEELLEQLEHFGRHDDYCALRVSRGRSRQALRALVEAGSFRVAY
jgi:hypothetical protein